VNKSKRNKSEKILSEINMWHKRMVPSRSLGNGISLHILSLLSALWTTHFQWHVLFNEASKQI